jgi:hypothetical protein
MVTVATDFSGENVVARDGIEPPTVAPDHGVGPIPGDMLESLGAGELAQETIRPSPASIIRERLKQSAVAVLLPLI